MTFFKRLFTRQKCYACGSTQKGKWIDESVVSRLVASGLSRGEDNKLFQSFLVPLGMKHWTLGKARTPMQVPTIKALERLLSTNQWYLCPICSECLPTAAKNS